MYKFRSLQANYVLKTSVTRQDNIKSLLCTEYALEARCVNIDEYYLFTINRIHSELENSQNLVDGLMRELGDALFPVELCVDEHATIKKVRNFEAIKERWENVASDIMDRGYSLPTDQYIQLARANFANRKRFLERFSRQTFIQLFFRNPACRYFNYATRNISHTQTVDMFSCDRIGDTDDTVMFECRDDETLLCRFEYCFSEVGDVVSVKGDIPKKEEEGEVSKQIELNVIAGSRQYKKANNFLSFVFD